MDAEEIGGREATSRSMTDPGRRNLQPDPLTLPDGAFLHRIAVQLKLPEAEISDSQGSWTPAVDVRATKDEFIFTVEVPGVQQKDVSVSVTGSGRAWD
jgi:HSP20 family molecular chaperone IbpA